MHRLRPVVYCLALAAALPALADSPEVVVTQHALPLPGGALRYVAEAGRIAIRDVETGEPHGYMFYTAYRVPVRRGPPRPLTFIWNGGPGAASTLLHFHVAGPRIAQGDRLVDNAASWLAFSDLVMVDPVGTGFSRPARAGYAAEFYNTRGDVASVAEFVRSWRLLHDAEAAPLYLAGESWGAGRAASVGHALQKHGVEVSGLVLISGSWGLAGDQGAPQLRDALRVVDMADAACFHGKLAPDVGTDAAGVRQATERWARERYAPALARIATLTEAERSDIATQLARYTGIAAASIDHKTLTISPRQFRSELLQAEGKSLYVLDLRRTAAPVEAAQAAMRRYFRDELGYRTDLPYVDMEDPSTGYTPVGQPAPVSINERWDYATADFTAAEREAAIQAAVREGGGPPRLGPPLPATAELIALNPRVRVLVVGGEFDGYLPCANGAEIAARLPPELARAIRFKCYAGGHALYLDEPARLEFTRDVRAFVGQRTGVGQPPGAQGAAPGP